MSTLPQRGRGRGRRRNAGFRSPGDSTGLATAVTGASQVYQGNLYSGGGTASAVHNYRQHSNAAAAPADMPQSRAKPGNSALKSCWDSTLSVHASAPLPSMHYTGHRADRSCEDGYQSRPLDHQDPTRAKTISTAGGTSPKNTFGASVDLPHSRAKPSSSAVNGYDGSVHSVHEAAPLSSAGPPGHVVGRSWKGSRQASHSQHQGARQRGPLAEVPNGPFNRQTNFHSSKPGGFGSTPSAKSSTRPSRGKHPKAFGEAEPLYRTAGVPSLSAGVGQLYALHLHESCPGLPPVADILRRLQAIQAEFQRDHLSMERQCSMTDMRHCWILDNLRTLNRILVRVDLELKEEEPQMLCISSLDKAVVAHSNSDWVFDACILFHLLLKRHRCIQTLNLDRTVIASGYPQVLCDALACNRSLRHLAITCWDFLPAMARPLVYSLCRMPALESVSISRLALQPDAASRIGNMLGRMKSLQSVQLLDNEMSFEAGEELMKGLSRNGNLKVIRFGNSALGPDGARCAGELLAKSSNLQELSLQSVPAFDEQQAVSIADGLRRNGSLHKLEIHGCSVPFRGIDAVAEVLKEGTLKCLVLSTCNIAQTESVSVMLECNKNLLEVDLRGNLIDNMGAIRLAQALQFNQHLLKLNLEGNRINSRGVIALVNALKANTVLKELTLGCFEPDDGGDEEAVMRALDRTAAYDRVRLCYDTRGIFQLSANLLVNANRITSVHLDSSVELDAACLKDLFVALATVSCLKDLCIESPATIDGTAARRLSKLLTTTTTLQLLNISACNMDSIAVTAVMTAMEKNKSVTQLDMDYSVSDVVCTNAFIAMIKNNQTLTHFGYMSTKLSELQVIARELLANYTLTTFKIWERRGFAETVFEINEILRRNSSFLNRTVEYALYPYRFGGERAPALSFLDAYQLKPVQKHLAKLAGSEAAVERALRNAHRHIKFYLFSITGVSPVPVRCWPHPKGATQMDCLNDACWRSIFSYLEITDIST